MPSYESFSVHKLMYLFYFLCVVKSMYVYDCVLLIDFMHVQYIDIQVHVDLCRLNSFRNLFSK